ncbi:hypothetical protein NQZ70_07005 [Sorangium sp. Soce836]|nr:hypothetical protein NQZ70_07005 [Sorangium sp. Soce836]
MALTRSSHELGNDGGNRGMIGISYHLDLWELLSDLSRAIAVEQREFFAFRGASVPSLPHREIEIERIG